MDTSTITITFGDVAENHARMQKLGTLATEGFSVKELLEMKDRFEKEGCFCEMISLPFVQDDRSKDLDAYILIVRKAIDTMLTLATDDIKKPKGTIDKESLKGILQGKFTKKTGVDMFKELTCLDWDKKAKMHGRVVNKKARWNLCFDDLPQEPDYESGKGRIVAYKDVPLTKIVKDALPGFIGKKSDSFTFVGEGNYYYDVKKCYIGAHGDGERRMTVGLRLGATFPLHYQWYLKSSPVGEKTTINLNHGDLYVMSDVAVGHNWLKRNIPTLRHSAGFPENLKFSDLAFD